MSGTLIVMPLDTGAFADGPRAGDDRLARRPRLVLDPDIQIGRALRQARESLGLTLDEISETTRVRARHLASIEDAQLDLLPSRPFTVGYVRAYAKALGLDADATAARYRTEYPSPDDELRNPVRVERPRRNGLLVAVVAVLAVSVVAWNVTLRVLAHPAAKPALVAAPRPAGAPVTNAATTGPFSVDAPLPAPPEATAPAPYITPVVGKDAANTVAAPPAPPAQPPEAVHPFVAAGVVYGPAKGASALIIQARKSISLEVRGPGGVVYFARQLAAGEAYRVPALPNLTAEVSNPASAELFEGGVSKGPFTQAQMPLKTVG